MALVFLRRIGKFGGEPIKQQDQFIERDNPVIERENEFPEETVFPQLLRHGNRPRLVIGINRFPEPQLVLGLEIGLVILIALRAQGFHLLRRNDVAALDLAIRQKFFCGNKGFRDNRIRGKGFAKNLAGISADPLRFLFAQRGGGSYTTKALLLQFQPAFKPPDQASQVRSLGAVEGMDFINHQIF